MSHCVFDTSVLRVYHFCRRINGLGIVFMKALYLKCAGKKQTQEKSEYRD